MTISLQSIFISSLISEKNHKWLPNERKKIMFESINMAGACRRLDLPLNRTAISFEILLCTNLI